VWILIAALILTTATEADVSLKKLDGSSVSGTLQSWRDGQLVLLTTDGQLQIGESEVLSLERSVQAASTPAAATPTDLREPILELVDGTVLPLAEYSTTGKRASVSLRNHTTAGSQPIVVDIKRMKSVRLQPMSEALAKEWQEVVASAAAGDSPTPSDLLVVLKRGGQSLDYLEGVIGQVIGKDIEFTHEGETVRVSRDKVAGIVFYRAKSSSEETPRCVLTGADELSLRAAKVRLDGDVLQITTSSGVNVAWPWNEVTSADFSAGKLVFLSDLKPVSQSWQPLIPLPTSAVHAASIGQPRFDRGGVGGPLSVWYPDGDLSPATGHSESFAKGVALRSRTEIAYRLPHGFNRFLAVAGIDPATRSSGDVLLSLFGDDRTLLEREMTGHDAPLPLEIDVTGVKQLRIVVDYGENLDTGDWLNLCNARIVK
jgi:hypothetical protein